MNNCANVHTDLILLTRYWIQTTPNGTAALQLIGDRTKNQQYTLKWERIVIQICVEK